MPPYARDYGYRWNISGYFPRAIKLICIACIAMFFVQEVSHIAFRDPAWQGWAEHWLGLVPVDAVFRGHIWQFATYLFLHATILHILFNLLYLVMFGADLEHMWGTRKFATYFFTCGIGAGLIDVIVRLSLHSNTSEPTIGASGAIYGILLACAVIMPHRQVMLFPLPVTITMRWLVIILGGIEFFSTLGVTGDNVSHICHLGGMAVGYLFLRRDSFLYSFRNQVNDYQRRRLKKKFEVYVRDHKSDPPSRPDNWVN
jgi:membrane associated rhomboid family serine protease